MRYFNVPYYFDEEEKIIGGKLTFRQLGYIGAGGLVGLLLGYLAPFPLAVRLFLGVTAFAIGGVFAFVKLPKYDTRLDTLLVLLFKFRSREKEFPFRRG